MQGGNAVGGTLKMLGAADITRILGMEQVLELVEMAFIERGHGRVQMPPKSYLFFERHEGDLRVMPAFLEGLGQAGVKLVNVHPRNPAVHSLPTVLATIVLISPETGEPLCIMDGTVITAMRTAAASAVATKYLARPSSRTVGVIGAGQQSFYQLDAISRVLSLEEVTIFDLVQEKADRLASLAATRLNLEAKVCATPAEAVRGKDVIVTVTPSTEPVVKDEWMSAGMHINCVGADGPGKQELEGAILGHSRIIVDDWEQASHSGEINVPFSRGDIKREDVAGEIGEVVAGFMEGRTSESEITIFDTTGLAIQDVVCAWRAYEAAAQRNMGVEMDNLYNQ